MERSNVRLPIQVIDIDKEESVANEYGIRSVPCMIMMDENIEMKRFVGVKTVNQINDWVNND